jgi:hypothetical protein
MKTYTNYHDLKSAYPEIAAVTRTVLTDDDIKEPFLWGLGGDVFVCESKEEFDKVTQENQYPEMAEEIIEGWFLIFYVSNNGGGPSYYCPMRYLDRNNLPSVE